MTRIRRARREEGVQSNSDFVGKNDDDRHEEFMRIRSGKERRFTICRRATYSYVLVGGVVAKNKSTQNKRAIKKKFSECKEQQVG